MAKVEQKALAPKVELPFGRETTIERLEAAGISVPDQAVARRMMEAARLNLAINATQARINRAWFRRMIARDWQVYSYDRYVEHPYREDFGGLPLSIERYVGKVRAAAPDVKLFVHAKLFDPFLVTEDGTILRGWFPNTVFL